MVLLLVKPQRAFVVNGDSSLKLCTQVYFRFVGPFVGFFVCFLFFSKLCVHSVSGMKYLLNEVQYLHMPRLSMLDP